MGLVYFLSIFSLLACSTQLQPRNKIKTNDATIGDSSGTIRTPGSSGTSGNGSSGSSSSGGTPSGADATAGDGSEEGADAAAGSGANTGSGNSSVQVGGSLPTTPNGNTGIDLEVTGNENSSMTFDDVQSLFITDPASGLEGCTAVGCHGAEKDNRGPNATSDLSSYEAITDVEQSQPGVLILYLTKGGMPKSAAYSEADIQKVADWVAAGMPPGVGAGAGAGAGDVQNATLTSAEVLTLLGPGMGNCAQAGCHVANGGLRDLSSVDAIKLEANIWIARINNANAALNMPRLNGQDAANTIAISADQKAMIQAWIDAGTPD